MPWCPKCKTEYVDGITKCADCGSVLTNIPPKETAKPKEHYIDDEPALFFTADDPVTAQLIEARLESAGIPHLLKPHKGYIHIAPVQGYSAYGGDIFVPSKLMERARIAAGLDGNSIDETDTFSAESFDRAPEDDASFEASETPAEETGENSKPDSRSKLKTVLSDIGIVLIIALVLIAFFTFDGFLGFLRKLAGY